MRALKWIIGIVVVPFLGIAAAFFLIPADRIVAVVAGQFEAQTGRTLTVGLVRPSLTPLGVAASDIEISNADWSTRGPMLRAKSLNVSVDLGSLFSGSPRIRGVQIDTPEIMLERSVDGAANWDFGPGETKGPDDEGSATAFTLDNLKISGGRLTYATPGQETVVEDLSLRTALLGPEVAMVLNFGAVVGGIPLSGDVTVDRPGAFSDGGQSGLTATVSLGAAEVAFVGTYAHGGDTLLIGDYDLSIPSTGDLMVALGLPDPALQPGFGQSVTANGPIEVAPSLISSAQSAFMSGPTALGVAFAIDLAGDVPHIQADLSTGDLDLTSLAGEEDADDGSTGWSTDPMSAAVLSAVNANIGLVADQLTYGDTIMKDVAIDAAFSDGVLNTNINRMQAYGGAITGAFRVSGENSVAMSGSLNANGVSLKDFMGDMFGFERIQGAGDVTVKFAGAGGSMHGLMNSLDGSGNINFGKGEILGFDLAGMLSNLDSAFGDSAASTIFNSITATFEIVDGVVTNVDLNLLAPLLEAVGEGTIGLGDQTMNYRVTPKLLHGDGTGFSVPVLITGSWSNLKFRPDLEGLLDLKAKEAIKAVEEEVVKAVEEEIKKKVEDEVLKSLGKLLGGN